MAGVGKADEHDYLKNSWQSSASASRCKFSTRFVCAQQFGQTLTALSRRKRVRLSYPPRHAKDACHPSLRGGSFRELILILEEMRNENLLSFFISFIF